MENLFFLNSKLLSTTLQAHAMVKDSFDLSSLICGNLQNKSFPIVFKQKYGTVLTDFIDTGYPSLFLISEKVKSILESNNIKGWLVYEIELLDKRGKQISGYYGLAVPHFGGNLFIDERSKKIIDGYIVYTKVFIKENINENSFYLAKNYNGIMVTKKIVDLFKNNSLTNVIFENLSNVNFDDFTVKNFFNEFII